MKQMQEQIDKLAKDNSYFVKELREKDKQI